MPTFRDNQRSDRQDPPTLMGVQQVCWSDLVSEPLSG